MFINTKKGYKFTMSETNLKIKPSMSESMFHTYLDYKILNNQLHNKVIQVPKILGSKQRT